MTQRTMKHNEWVKIVESRHRQKKQNTTVKTTLPIWSMLLGGFIILSAAWTYFVDSSSEQVQVAAIDSSAQKRITRYFSKQFMMGSWKFNNIDFKSGELNVFIQIPTKLAMSEHEVKEYIRNSLCPAANNRVWQDVQNNDMYIYLYTDMPRTGKYALCNS
ncbi:hypothetical protein [Pseudoalteromonas rubra]|uniref:hypothetical protein n=1 Tax=Pseudoalteromonas rubra TaxID=43658 RepID=UPI000F768D73|nr:hypothetical protein [Pseudoalteromonas rubra]